MAASESSTINMDLRDIDGEDAPYIVSRKLRVEPPLWFRDAGGSESSGIDALVQVIRHTKSFLADPSCEVENSLVTHAWRDFNPFCKSQEYRREHEEAKKALAEELRALPDVSNLTFWELASSSFVCSSLWSSKDWLAYDACWYRREEWEEQEPHSREVQGRLGMAEMDCRGNESLSLQEAVNSLYLPKMVGGVERMLFSKAPTFFRVDYHNHEKKPHGLKELQQFKMICWVHEFEYRLIAVVRMRTDGALHDYVRTYTPQGNPVTMVSRQGIINKAWRIGDLGRNHYMLIYMCGATVINADAPEVAYGLPTDTAPIHTVLPELTEAFRVANLEANAVVASEVEGGQGSQLGSKGQALLNESQTTEEGSQQEAGLQEKEMAARVQVRPDMAQNDPPPNAPRGPRKRSRPSYGRGDLTGANNTPLGRRGRR